MTKMSKIKIEARRRAQSAHRKVRNTERKLSGLRVEAQRADIEEQIASLQEQKSALLREEDRDEGIVATSAISKVQSPCRDQSSAWGKQNTLNIALALWNETYHSFVRSFAARLALASASNIDSCSVSARCGLLACATGGG